MITAALSAALVGALAFFGISLSAMQIAGVVVAMKVLVVLSVVLIGIRVKRKREALAGRAPGPPPARP